MAACDQGATAIEWVGIFMLAAILVGAIMAVVPNTPLVAPLKHAVCLVLQGVPCADTPEPEKTRWERAASGRYVNMTDSYGSSEGAGPYSAETNFDDRNYVYTWEVFGVPVLQMTFHASPAELPALPEWIAAHPLAPATLEIEGDWNRCHRSENGYAELLNRELNPAGGLTNVGCSGATIDDIQNPNHRYPTEPAQIEALGDDVTLVTMSMGGNDVHFADIVTKCVLSSDCTGTDLALSEAEWAALEERLVAHYQLVQQAAPNSDLVVIGYPRLFNQPRYPATDGMAPYNIYVPAPAFGAPKIETIELLSVEEQMWMNEQSAKLNEVIRSATEKAGVTFVNPTDAYADHGIGSEDPWIHELRLELPGPNHSGQVPVSMESFHPNDAGQAAEAQLIETVLMQD